MWLHFIIAPEIEAKYFSKHNSKADICSHDGLVVFFPLESVFEVLPCDFESCCI